MRNLSRILLILDKQHGDLTRIFEGYAEQHELAWSLSVIETKAWKEGTLLRKAMPFDAVIGWTGPAIPPALPASRMPCIRFSGGNHWPDCVNICMDNEATGRLAARHFHQQGYKTVAIVRKLSFPARRERCLAFLAEAQSLGLQILHFEPQAQDDPATADRHLAEWLCSFPPPIGVFLYQDDDAHHFLDVANMAGIKVPGQVGILGVDDLPFCQYVKPQLSSIMPPYQQAAASMCLHLHRYLAGAQRLEDVIKIAPLRVAQRQSTALATCGDALIDKFRRAMQKHPQHSIASIATSSGLSYSQFNRRFTKACGIGPKTFLGYCRIQLAQQLLSTTDDSVEQIAKRCGYTGGAGLRAAFRAAELPTPQSCRHGQRVNP